MSSVTVASRVPNAVLDMSFSSCRLRTTQDWREAVRLGIRGVAEETATGYGVSRVRHTFGESRTCTNTVSARGKLQETWLHCPLPVRSGPRLFALAARVCCRISFAELTRAST